MGWLIFLLLIAGGVVVYRYLVNVEAEIRAEIAAPESAGDTPSTGSGPEPTIIDIVKNHPGILQTDIYKEFPGVDRKLIQKELLELDQSGRISRKKHGSTYQLTILD